jgi:hypothetical protein
MAGSRKWFVYSDDTGVDYAINLDESNTEAINGTDGDFTDTSAVVAAVPRNIKTRALYYANADRTRVIKCTALTLGAYAAVVSGTNAQTITDPIAGTGNLVLIRAEGERRRIPFAADTGLNDGDAT